MRQTLQTLLLFERDCMSTFVAKEEKEAQESIDQRIRMLEQR